MHEDKKSLFIHKHLRAQSSKDYKYSEKEQKHDFPLCFAYAQ